MHALDGFTLPDWWTTHFGVTPPLGYRLRIAYPERWFRIHSDPERRAALLSEYAARRSARADGL